MLQQAEAEALLAMHKRFVDFEAITISPGLDKTYELIGTGENEKEKFQLDLWRGTIRISKVKYQTRGRKTFVLARLELNGSPHTNPDGTRLDGNHLHIYSEGYEDKWAVPIDASLFRDISSMVTALEDFCRFCNVDALPVIRETLL